jgi:hypothetical protein
LATCGPQLLPRIDRKRSIHEFQPYSAGGILTISGDFSLISWIFRIFGVHFSTFRHFSSSDTRQTNDSLPRLMYCPSEIRFAVYTLLVFSVSEKHLKTNCKMHIQARMQAQIARVRWFKPTQTACLCNCGSHKYIGGRGSGLEKFTTKSEI